MKSGRRMIGFILCLFIGLVLLGLSFAGLADEYWRGMGSGLVAVSVGQLIRLYRFRKDEAYREKVRIESTDERNRFISGRAWAWAGYLYIMFAAAASIVLRVMGENLLSLAAGCSLCLMLLLYVVAWMVLRRRY